MSVIIATTVPALKTAKRNLDPGITTHNVSVVNNCNVLELAIVVDYDKPSGTLRVVIQER